MRIGEVASQAGIGVETVRFYESRGLIVQPLRPADGGYRDYPADIVHRIRFIQRAKQLGFSLLEIRQLLDLEAGPASECADVRAKAEVKLAEVRAKLECLAQIETVLQVLIAACPGKGPVQHCSILGELRKRDLQMISSGTEK